MGGRALNPGSLVSEFTCLAPMQGEITFYEAQSLYNSSGSVGKKENATLQIQN